MSKISQKSLLELAKLTRYYILTSTTAAGTGHPTSSLSATDLMVSLMFGGFFKADLNDPQNPNNDRLIFSKGHGAPLFYCLYAAAGKVSEKELMTLRKFGSKLEGHPTMEFPYTESATGSLGQGLSIGLGMALNAKLEKLDYRTFVLMGDSEMAEGSVWEAMEIASYYKLNNLIAIADINRLGQRGETMYGHDLKVYQKRAEAFGWNALLVDGHNIKQIVEILKRVQDDKSNRPTIIIAKTLKGKGVSFLEDKDNWHGKALKPEDLEKALVELGEVNKTIRGKLTSPHSVISSVRERYPDLKPRDSEAQPRNDTLQYRKGDMVSTRKAYGNALVKVLAQNPKALVLDAEVSNSTYSESVKKDFPERFLEMFIAEQNMVSVALGFSRRGKIPFVSTFAAFFSRAFDQIRMSQYSQGNIKFVGSHVGVSIGEDGSSQMGLEDIAMFRTLLNSVVLYPSDAVSSEKLVFEANNHQGNVYLRTTRMETPVIYGPGEDFKIGGSKIHRPARHPELVSGSNKKIIIIGAGVTLHEALKAQVELASEKIEAIVVDLYSVKPVDQKTLIKLSKETNLFLTVEDHFAEGGLGEAVKSALSETGSKIYSLAVTKMPRSGKPMELLEYELISKRGIINQVKQLVKNEH